MSKKVGIYIILFVLTGCATTTDPREGGIFSYNPKAYEQRLEERRETVAVIGNNQQDQIRLEREVEVKRQLLVEQKKQLNVLDTELDDIQKRIAMYRAHSQEHAANKVRLEHEIHQVEARLQAIQKESGDSPHEVEEKQARIQQLRADIEQLSKVVSLLLQSAQ